MQAMQVCVDKVNTMVTMAPITQVSPQSEQRSTVWKVEWFGSHVMEDFNAGVRDDGLFSIQLSHT